MLHLGFPIKGSLCAPKHATPSGDTRGQWPTELQLLLGCGLELWDDLLLPREDPGQNCEVVCHFDFPGLPEIGQEDRENQPDQMAAVHSGQKPVTVNYAESTRLCLLAASAALL